jgi:hypothetical protein
MKETLEEAIVYYIYKTQSSQPLYEIVENAIKFGVKWQKENSQSIVPFDAYDIEVFKIEADENGKLFAYVGYKITNGNFLFNIVPFTEPKYQQEQSDLRLNHTQALLSNCEKSLDRIIKEDKKKYSEEDVLKSADNLGFKQITSEELNSLPYQPFITDEDGNIWVIDKEKWFEQFKNK